MMWVMRVVARVVERIRGVGRRRREDAFWRAAAASAVEEYTAPMRALMRKRPPGPSIIEAKHVRLDLAAREEQVDIFAPAEVEFEMKITNVRIGDQVEKEWLEEEG